MLDRGAMEKQAFLMAPLTSTIHSPVHSSPWMSLITIFYQLEMHTRNFGRRRDWGTSGLGRQRIGAWELLRCGCALTLK